MVVLARTAKQSGAVQLTLDCRAAGLLAIAQAGLMP